MIKQSTGDVGEMAIVQIYDRMQIRQLVNYCY